MINWFSKHVGAKLATCVAFAVAWCSANVLGARAVCHGMGALGGAIAFVWLVAAVLACTFAIAAFVAATA